MIATRKRILLVLILLGFCLACFSGCFTSSRNATGDSFDTYKIDYRDISGVTAEEINDIEALKTRRGHFTYAMTLSPEAFVSENGEIVGYSALICEWLTDIFGIRFQPEIYLHDELIEKLDAQIIDFSGDLTPIGEYRSQYYMTDSTTERQVMTMRLSESLTLEQVSAHRPPRYVFLSGAQIDKAIARAPGANDYETVWAASFQEAYHMLESGAADAIVGPQVADISFYDNDGLVVEDFYPIVFAPAAIATASRELEPIISVITKALQSGAMPYLNHLYNRGNDDYIRHKFNMSLDEEEKAYLRDTVSVPLAAQYFNYPIVFYNSHEKKWDGITFDLLREVEKLTGLSFDIINSENAEMGELMAMLNDGSAHMFSDLIFTPERAPHYIWSDYKYMSDQLALLSKSDYPNVNMNEIPFTHVALIKDTAHAEMFQAWFPNAVNTTLYENVDEAFLALEKGEVQMVMAARSKLLYYSNYFEFSGYKANFLFDHSYVSAFAYNKEQTVLRSIMDKALLGIDTDRLVDQWVTKTYDYQAQLISAQRPWLIGAIGFLIILALILAILVKNQGENRRLSLLKEQAEQSNRAKSEFLSRMSHEIRTPMNAILGATAIQLQKSSQPPDIEEAFNTIYNSGSILLNIINDLLDLSKIESGKLEIKPVKYDIPSLINDTVQLNLVRYDDKPIEFDLLISEDTPLEVIGDELRIKQILNNLLSNAFKYTSSGNIKLSVSSEEMDDSVGDGSVEVCCLVFCVSDTGQGMTQEDIGRLYDDYTRFNREANRDVVGVGLGMSIAKRLIDLMGGEISVESELGVGTVFTVKLPQERIGSAVCGKGLADSLWRNRFQNTSHTMRLQITRKDLSGGRILIVDDILSNIYVAKGLLAPYSLEIDTASSGFEALAKINSGNEYDIIFMDHMMPVMDGIEATAVIRDIGYTRPIVALTANAVAGQAELFLSSGFDRFISKPIDIRELDLLLTDLIPHKEPTHKTKNHDAADREAAPAPLESEMADLYGYFIIDAENILKVLDGIFAKPDAPHEEDVESYTIALHGIKRALLSMGYKSLSDNALKLEQAGRDGNLAIIKSETPIFTKSLRELLEELREAIA